MTCLQSEDELDSLEVLTSLKTAVAHLKFCLNREKFSVGFEEVMCGAYILLDRSIAREHLVVHHQSITSLFGGLIVLSFSMLCDVDDAD